MFLSVETSFKLANNSIYELRKERFDKTLGLYKDFVDRFPISEYTDQAKDYFDRSSNELNKLKTN